MILKVVSAIMELARQCGVRQGDPIAAYSFTLAIELLAIEIRENENVKGIQINNTNIKLSMYADDMTGLVVGIPSIKRFMKIINDFKIYSGLGVNKDKTELMPLGISDKNDTAIFRNKNFSIPLSKIKKSFNMWKQRNLQ